jgi:hypothetical protein
VAATPGSTSSVAGPWGGAGAKGPFWDLFVPSLAGVKAPPTPAPGTVGAGGLGGLGAGMGVNRDMGPVDAFTPPDDNGPKMMYNAFQFTFTFKVHVK